MLLIARIPCCRSLIRRATQTLPHQFTFATLTTSSFPSLSTCLRDVDLQSLLGLAWNLAFNASTMKVSTLLILHQDRSQQTYCHPKRLPQRHQRCSKHLKSCLQHGVSPLSPSDLRLARRCCRDGLGVRVRAVSFLLRDMRLSLVLGVLLSDINVRNLVSFQHASFLKCRQRRAKIQHLFFMRPVVDPSWFHYFVVCVVPGTMFVIEFVFVHNANTLFPCCRFASVRPSRLTACGDLRVLSRHSRWS